MKNVIIRNMERLLDNETAEREPIEPMTDWKWNELYKLTTAFHLTPWIAEGLRAYADDFFMQMPETLQQLIMTSDEEKNQENLEHFYLYVDRSQGALHQIKPNSLKAYFRDLVKTVKNIEE